MSKTRKDLVKKTDEMSLLNLPPDVIKIAIPATANAHNDYAAPEATDIMRVLSKTWKTTHKFFRPELDKRDAKQLLEYVLQGNEDKALKIAKANPRLFFIKATVMDYAMDLEGNRRTIKDWSPYQALFGTGDKTMLAAVKPHLDAYLKTLSNGNDLAAEQEQEKFPNGFDYPPSTDEFNKLVNELAVAITEDLQLKQNWKNPSPATLDVLAKIRKHLKPGIVETGHHFNMNNFIKTHEIYDQNWDPWNGNQLDFFSVNVIGFQERLLTAPYLQAACMGLNNHINKNQPLSRSFEVMNYVIDKKIMVVPFTSEDSSCRLGEGFVVDSYYGVAGAFFLRGWWPAGLLENYVKQTPRSFQDLCTCQRNKWLCHV